jgi:EpsI family protein
LGQIIYRRVIIVVICLALTSVFIYLQPSSRAVKKKVPLSEALSNLKGWTTTGLVPIDKKIINALELDDYANQNYSNGTEVVSLYIGFYLTTEKVGAAHDPLVCFPGQGWVVSKTNKDKFLLNPGTEETIAYSTMTVQKGPTKELIIYWFQSYDRTNPGTFSQKIMSLWNKILMRNEGNAFVRITIPIGERSLSQCRETIFQFVKTFYPVFLNYIKNG